MSAVNSSRSDPRWNASAGFESEMRTSPKPVIVVLALVGVVFVVWGTAWLTGSDQIYAFCLAMLLYVFSVVAWLLDRWKPTAGRWFTVLALISLVLLSEGWLHVPGTRTLLVIPTALAATLISLPAATFVAAGETVANVLRRSCAPACPT